MRQGWPEIIPIPAIVLSGDGDKGGEVIVAY